jgi:hypothetical protein
MMDIIYTIGPRRYVTPFVVTTSAFLPEKENFVSPVFPANTDVALTISNSVVGNISLGLLRPISDAAGVAFDDGLGGAFHIY